VRTWGIKCDLKNVICFLENTRDLLQGGQKTKQKKTVEE